MYIPLKKLSRPRLDKLLRVCLGGRQVDTIKHPDFNIQKGGVNIILEIKKVSAKGL